MKKKQDSIMDKFNLPSYTKGKTFAEASKAIAKKFEGREDKESIDTLQDLQGRLQQAQEFVKAKSQPQQSPEQGQPQAPQPQAPMAMGGQMGEDSNDYFLGGIMSSLGGAGGAAAGAAGAAEAAGGASGLLGKVGGGAIPGMGLLSKAPEAIGHFKSGNAAKGIMSAASGAASMIPGVGAIASPILDMAGKFIGNGQAKQDAQDLAVNDTATKAKQFNNPFANGGFMDSTDPNELIKMLGNTEPKDPSGYNPNIEDDINDEQTAFKKSNDYFAGEADKRSAFDASNDYFAGEADKAALAGGSTNAHDASNAAFAADADARKASGYSTEDTNEEVESKYDPSSLLRYAPAVTDAYQLATLEKPDEVSRNKLGNKYDPQNVDERQLVKGVQEGINNQRDAILGSSGGSQSAARANLLGLSLQGTKALSSAMAQAGSENRQENRAGQQFNLGVDQTNLQQSNAEQLANEQNKGAYDTQKSQLISQLGSNLGEVGKEQLFKKYPELMGMDFDALGKYLKTNKKKKGKLA
jgi:hypothetical protein